MSGGKMYFNIFWITLPGVFIFQSNHVTCHEWILEHCHFGDDNSIIDWI